MSNVLNYILNLNGNMVSMLNRIGSAGNDATDDLRGLRSEADSLNKVNIGGFLSSITRVASALGVGALLGKTIKAGMEQEMKNVSFEVLFDSADSAKKMIDDINGYAAKAYGSTAVTNAVQMMAGFDIAKDQIMPNLKAIGDIAMGDVGKFNSLTLAFSQMSSTGKLMGQDLLQMINAGFNPLVQMSKTTGKSVAQLKDDMSKGLITTEMVTKAFQDATKQGGQFHGMVDRMAETTGGQWDLAINKLSLKLLSLYDNVLQPIIFPALQVFNKFLDDPIGTITRLTDRFTTDFPIISGLIIGVTAALVTFKTVMGIVTIATKLWAGAQLVLNAILTANPVGLVIAGIVALIALITFLIVKIDGWGETWDNVIKFCSLVFDSFKANLQLKWMQIQDFFMRGLETIEKGWYKLQSLWNEDAANAGLAKLESQRNERAKEIAQAQNKINEINKQIAGLDVIQLKMNDTSFSDIANKLKQKIGISTPGVPGTDMMTGLATVGGGGNRSGGAGSAGKSTANSIATGGQKSTNITITIGEMGNNMVVHAGSTGESAAEIRDIVLDNMTRALAMAQGQI